ncbi:tRNA pseudouridine synthase B [Synergistales bacterium]|nr:tRNA pseudouridine synthase B [Synergistales bacterium]
MRRPAFIIIDKPVGERSTSCVENVRRALGQGVKAGHGGTLDSSASGVLVLLVYGSTRLSGVVMSMPKVYRTVVRLGFETTTCDYDGEKIISEFPNRPEDVREEDMDSALFSFIGWRMQYPPKVSAVHVNGRRAHDIFRAGGDPDIEPRPVFIESIERLGKISEGCAELRVSCGKGTYIRSIARDLGRSLGCGAHIASLVRERVGVFDLNEALRYDSKYPPSRAELIGALRGLDILENFLPSYTLPGAGSRALSNGIAVRFSDAERRSFGSFPPRGEVSFSGEDFFSVAHMERRGSLTYAVPDINIKYESPPSP